MKRFIFLIVFLIAVFLEAQIQIQEVPLSEFNPEFSEKRIEVKDGLDSLLLVDNRLEATIVSLAVPFVDTVVLHPSFLRVYSDSSICLKNPKVFEERILETAHKLTEKSLTELTAKEAVLLASKITGWLMAYDYEKLERIETAERIKKNLKDSLSVYYRRDDFRAASEAEKKIRLAMDSIGLPNASSEDLLPRKGVCTDIARANSIIFNILKETSSGLCNVYMTTYKGYYIIPDSLEFKLHAWNKIVALKSNRIEITFLDPTNLVGDLPNTDERDWLLPTLRSDYLHAPYTEENLLRLLATNSRHTFSNEALIRKALNE